jgi:ankyrin repeat protein
MVTLFVLVMAMTQITTVSEILQAKYSRNEHRVEEILATGIELNIFEAAATGQTARVRALVAADPSLVNTYAPDGFFPLALAVFFGNGETAAALLDAGADVRMQSREAMKISSLHSAIGARRLDLVAMLLARGADPNARAETGLTPLHSAAQDGATDIARALIDAGADVNVRDDRGRSPLDLAVEHGRQATAVLLRS